MDAEELGEIRREFKPGLENIIAGIIIGILLIGAGCAAVYFPIMGALESAGPLPFWTEKGQKGWSWGAVGIFVALGLGLLVGGFFLVQWMRSLVSLRIYIGANGFAVSQKKTTQIFAWEEIESVRETRLYERPPILKGVAKYALPKMMSKIFLITIKERDSFGFDGNSIKGHSKLAQMIKDETDRRSIPWEIVEEHV
jgi:hypothetical protein